LIKDKESQPIVVVVGGENEGGMETWNPLTSEIKLLWEKIPIFAEGETRHYHYDAGLLPINLGTGFLLYGGYKGYYSSDEIYGGYKRHDITSDEIWKYTVQNNTWER